MSSPKGWSLNKDTKSMMEWENRSGDALVILRKADRGNWHLFLPTAESTSGLSKRKGHSMAVDWMKMNPDF